MLLAFHDRALRAHLTRHERRLELQGSRIRKEREERQPRNILSGACIAWKQIPSYNGEGRSTLAYWHMRACPPNRHSKLHGKKRVPSRMRNVLGILTRGSRRRYAIFTPRNSELEKLLNTSTRRCPTKNNKVPKSSILLAIQTGKGDRRGSQRFRHSRPHYIQSFYSQARWP